MAREAEARCLGCGCTDSRACPGGCTWELVDRFARIGVCNRCFVDVERRIGLLRRFTTEQNKARHTVATR